MIETINVRDDCGTAEMVDGRESKSVLICDRCATCNQPYGINLILHKECIICSRKALYGPSIQAPKSTATRIREWWDKLMAHRHRHHARRLFVFFFVNRSARFVDAFSVEGNNFKWEGVISAMTPIQAPPTAVTSIFSNDPNGVSVVVLEADDSGTKFFPPAGPLSYTVSDPSNTVKQGLLADGVTPSLVPNGTGNTGSVGVAVRDSGNNLVGNATLSVAAPPPPPPPPAATQLGVFFEPIVPAASAPAASAAPTANAAGLTITDPHKSA